MEAKHAYYISEAEVLEKERAKLLERLDNPSCSDHERLFLVERLDKVDHYIGTLQVIAEQFSFA